ncbi:uncharacterized protein LOC113292746 [Papaver somniferum]|uniref:uncharacterized protein LOC113292746 n=1 Tax=Papaver somniferum TaxID=3469 RepID=UPI000E704705|nr:uncharacterized protein LOC113292746 [Papaver somniferum]
MKTKEPGKAKEIVMENEEQREEDEVLVIDDSNIQTLKELKIAPLGKILDRRGKKAGDVIASDSARREGRKKVTGSGRRVRTARVNSSAQDGRQEGIEPSAPQVQEIIEPSAPQIQEDIQPSVQPEAREQEEGQPSGTQEEEEVVKKEIAKKGKHLFRQHLKYHSDAVRLLKPTAAPTKMMDCPLDGEYERFKTIIANSGLASAAENSMLEHDRVAISEFFERLYPENDTFHMPFGEIMITPDDVVQILRLADHGTAVKYEYTKLLRWEKLYELTN